MLDILIGSQIYAAASAIQSKKTIIHYKESNHINTCIAGPHTQH